ncbi:CU044_5270 family protein [Streptosporangium sp. NPDC002721]|uniref:CU044_5270 family protein n=1 Tax=Streptosporangium sp. NPDC002721 TaxID=3366188 RepID=UPI003677F26D
MNPIDQLRAARPGHLGDTPVDPRTRAAELSRAMAGPRRAPARRGVVRPGWGLGLAGAAAAVTAVAVTISATGGTVPDASPARPNPDLAISGPEVPGSTASGPASSSSASSSPTASASRVELSSRSILLAAAHGAARQPDTTGAYWHTASVTRMLSEAADGDYTVVELARNEGWTPLATGGEQWFRTRSLGARPASPDDEAAWRRAGSPTRIKVEVPGKQGSGGYGGYVVSTEPGEAKDDRSPLVDGDKVFWLGRNVTMKDLRGLPDDPGALKAWLLRAYKGTGTEADTPMSSDAWLFSVAIGLITEMPVTPRVRGAAFRMLADLKTAEVSRDVTDAEGRTGSAVAIEERVRGKADAKGPEGVLRNRLIFDEATGTALARDSVVVRPGGLQAGFEPGTVWHSQTILEAGWTDEKPAS